MFETFQFYIILLLLWLDLLNFEKTFFYIYYLSIFFLIVDKGTEFLPQTLNF